MTFRVKTLLFWSSTCLLVLTATACHRSAPLPASEPPKVTEDRITFPAASPALAGIKTAPVRVGSPAPLRLNGRLVWNDDVTARVFAPFAGRVEQVLAQLSQPVHAGDRLALVASPDYAQAQADARKAAADARLAEENYERLQSLLEHGAAARKDVEAAAAELERARAEEARAKGILTLRAGGLETGPLFPLTSSITGEIVERNVSPGQEVRPDQMLANAPQFFAPLFVISDPTRLWVDIDATEHELDGVRPGSRFVVKSSAFPGRSFRGAVTWIAVALDPATRMVRIRGGVANSDRSLKAEMFVTVEMETNRPAEPEAPASAVFIKGDRHFAYVEETRGVYVRHEVRIGSLDRDAIEVIDGLQPGDAVVVEGALLLDQLYRDARGS